jgi:hypothetical protein
MSRKPERRGDVPILIKEAGKAYEKDLKPTVNLLGKIFLGSAWPSEPKSEPVKHEPVNPRAVRLPSAQQIVIAQVDHTNREQPRSARPEVIIDAEIIEDEEIPRICPTCGGAGRLGRAGYEVSCPSCNWPQNR